MCQKHLDNHGPKSIDKNTLTTTQWFSSIEWTHFPSLPAQADKASANCSCPWIRPWVPRAVNKGGSKARGNGAYKVGQDVVVLGLACLTWGFWCLGGWIRSGRLPWWVACWVKWCHLNSLAEDFSNSIYLVKNCPTLKDVSFFVSSIKLECFKFFWFPLPRPPPLNEPPAHPSLRFALASEWDVNL